MKIACPHCTQRIDLDESWLGKLLDCPNCQGIIDVPRQATYEAMDTHAKNAAKLASLTQNLRRVRIVATAVLILVPILWMAQCRMMNIADSQDTAQDSPTASLLRQESVSQNSPPTQSRGQALRHEFKVSSTNDNSTDASSTGRVKKKPNFFQRLFGASKTQASRDRDQSKSYDGDTSNKGGAAIRAGQSSHIEFDLREIVQAYQKRFGDVPTRTYRTTVEDMMREFTEPDIVKIVDKAVIPGLSELGLARDYNAEALRMHFRNKPGELFTYAENLGRDAVRGLAERGAEIAGVRLMVGPDTAEATETSGPNQASAIPPEQREICYGIPAPGKPGFVVSPYSPDAGFIDVRDYSPDSEVTDTATGRVFLVPPAFSTTAEVEVVGWETSGQQSKVRLGNNTDTPLSGPFWLVGCDEQGKVCFKQPLDLPEPIPAAGELLTPVNFDGKDHQRAKTWRVGPQ